jgi:hypothetical protein
MEKESPNLTLLKNQKNILLIIFLFWGNIINVDKNIFKSISLSVGNKITSQRCDIYFGEWQGGIFIP